MDKKYFFIVAMLVNGIISAQNNIPLFTQYIYNTISINPAYAGNRDYYDFFFLHRNQWVGFEGAPKTYLFSFNSPINYKSGIGAWVSYDKLDPLQTIRANGAYSYSIEIGRYKKLSFGLQGGITHKSFNFSNFIQEDNNDEVFSNLQGEQDLKPNFGVGLYYNTEEFYVGLSAQNTLEETILNVSSTELATPFIFNATFIAGYVYKLKSSSTYLRPSLIVRYFNESKTEIDVSLNAKFYDKFSIGASHRLGSNIAALFGYDFTKSVFFGVSYDRSIDQEFNNTINSSGSFELFLRFSLQSSYKRILAPRYF